MRIVNKNILASNLFDDMIANKALVSYFGALDFEVTNQLIKNVDTALTKQDISSGTFKRIHASFAEGIENAYKHQKVIRDDNPGIVLCSIHKDYIDITIGNAIDIIDRVPLVDSISQILETKEETLKQNIRENLLNLNVENKNGAQIGLMRIAVNSKRNMSYTFKELKSGELFFMLNFRINLN